MAMLLASLREFVRVCASLCGLDVANCRHSLFLDKLPITISIQTVWQISLSGAKRRSVMCCQQYKGHRGHLRKVNLI